MVATSASWKHTPFSGGVALPYRADFDDAQSLRLQAGLVPEAMEDKWFIHFQAPHLCFHRSWTGEPVYRVALQARPGGAIVTQALWSSAAAESADEAQRAYQAQLLEFLVCNLLLGEARPFPCPPAAAAAPPGVLQHHVAGTAFAEAPARAKRPWWRFW